MPSKSPYQEKPWPKRVGFIGKHITEVLKKKDKRVKSVDWKKVLEQKDEAISQLAMVSIVEVKQQREAIMKQCPNPQPDGNYI